MNYEQAKAIITEVAPELHVDPDTGARHLCVRKVASSHPFSIMLPNHFPPAPIAYRAAEPEIPAHINEDGVPITALPAKPEILARSTEDQLAEVERATLLDSIKAAKEHL